MGRSFLVGLCESAHRTGLDRPAFSTTAILAGLVLAAFVFAGFSSLAVGGRGAGGGLFCVEAVAVFHGCSLFFLPIAEMATDGNSGCGHFPGGVA